MNKETCASGQTEHQLDRDGTAGVILEVLDGDSSPELHESSFRSVALSRPQATGECLLYSIWGCFYLNVYNFGFKNLCSLKSYWISTRCQVGLSVAYSCLGHKMKCQQVCLVENRQYSETLYDAFLCKMSMTAPFSAHCDFFSFICMCQ